MPFSYSDLPDLSSKTFIITGSTAGLGRAQAQILASHNAHVIVVGRSEPKVMEVVDSIKKGTKNENVEGMIADLSDLKSVAKFCDSFLSREIPLYSLTLNAATVPDKIQITGDGIEMQWQTNVLSQYMMCMRSLPALKKSPEARIVVVSAFGHAAIRSRYPMTLDYMNDASSYGMLTRYAETKCANVLFTHYLSKKLKEEGNENIFVNTLHPGIVATDIFKNLWAPFRVIAAWFFTSPENGAKTQTYLAASPEVTLKAYRGQYFLPDAKLSKASQLSTDDEYAEELIHFLDSLLQSHLQDPTK